jgi:anhydro-N-acetylmuramic acid kinase
MISVPKEYKAIGIMSGTSLDGIDIAFCTFLHKDAQWHYIIQYARTLPYSREWKSLLSKLPGKSKEDISNADIDYGRLIGKAINDFIEEHGLEPEFIGSHGHTLFHDPANGITLQIGDGQSIASTTGIVVVNDFRSQDLVYGGQGAPLVPVGDKLLFGDYLYCLNLGGFANVSFDHSGKRMGYDIAPCNIVLNHLSQALGNEFDEGGMMAKSGKLIMPLLDQLNSLPYYRQKPPKSLGREWLETNIHPLMAPGEEDPADLLRTLTEHVAIQVSGNIDGKVLVTGGGAYNTFLIERIREISQSELIIPDDLTIQYKEAMVFAFLALLRLRNEVNILGSVTGALRDHSSGKIHTPS